MESPFEGDILKGEVGLLTGLQNWGNMDLPLRVVTIYRRSDYLRLCLYNIMTAAAQNVKPVTLELGGKSPIVVFDDVDIDKVYDVSKATTKHTDESMFPTMIQSESGDSFFLVSAPDSAGSPPRRVPPSVDTNRDRKHSSIPPIPSNGSETTTSGVNHSYTVPLSSKSAMKTDALSLGLPSLRTCICWATSLLWNEASIGSFLLPNRCGDTQCNVEAVLQQDPSLALDILWMIFKL
ncbi:hypothetical protein L2E82_51631 [Cichorium intybus]|nr:hypothetical protein L2E82_51631 [Cichorium intybus]